MDLCEKYKVTMTESMAERLTELLPEKEADTDGQRVDILRRIADLCVSQQEYHLATKKYTQAGMKDKAMDALLKSGDTEKIIYFATVLRSKEIWIRAANYLQVVALFSLPCLSSLFRASLLSPVPLFSLPSLLMSRAWRDHACPPASLGLPPMDNQVCASSWHAQRQPHSRPAESVS
jgi:hypothetical protein